MFKELFTEARERISYEVSSGNRKLKLLPSYFKTAATNILKKYTDESIVYKKDANTNYVRVTKDSCTLIIRYWNGSIPEHEVYIIDMERRNGQLKTIYADWQTMPKIRKGTKGIKLEKIYEDWIEAAVEKAARDCI